MKVLLDTCVWGGAGDVLRAAGHEVITTTDWPADPGDEEILAYASRLGYVLVTLDKDFGELAIVRGLAHCGLIRLVGLPAEKQGLTCAMVLARYGEEIAHGAIATVDAYRVRIRPPDSHSSQS